MKPFFSHQSLSAISVFLFAIISTACEPEGVKPDPTSGLTKISSAYAAGLRVDLYANNELFAGYNPVTIFLYDSATGKAVSDIDVVLYPEMNMGAMKHSCPVENPTSAENGMQQGGAILFTMPSGEMGTWTVAVELRDRASQTLKGTAVLEVEVAETTPSQVLSFQTSTGARYYLSYDFPEKIRVGVNRFDVLAYTYKDGAFLPAQDLSIDLTPEMPSMDHGSPNNEHPTHTNGGHYVGKVNFTMTGEWRLHLKLSRDGEVFAEKYFDVVVP